MPAYGLAKTGGCHQKKFDWDIYFVTFRKQKPVVAAKNLYSYKV